MRKWFGILSLILTLAAASSASAQGFNFTDRNRAGTWTAGGSLGFTIDPELFLFTGQADYFLLHNVAIGPLMQFALDGDVFLFEPSVLVRGVFDLPTNHDFWRRVKPFAQGGIGLSVADAGGSDASFLINFGFGADVYLTSNISLGNNLLFNITPNFADVMHVAWQFVNFRYHF